MDGRVGVVLPTSTGLWETEGAPRNQGRHGSEDPFLDTRWWKVHLKPWGHERGVSFDESVSGTSYPG